jgi:hypothetical protein
MRDALVAVDKLQRIGSEFGFLQAPGVSHSKGYLAELPRQGCLCSVQRDHGRSSSLLHKPYDKNHFSGRNLVKIRDVSTREQETLSDFADDKDLLDYLDEQLTAMKQTTHNEVQVLLV